MKISEFVVGFILVKNSLCDTINISPHQTMTYINDNLVASQDSDLVSYPFKNKDIFNLQTLQENHSYTKIQNNFITQYDYKFFNPPGELSSRKSTYMLGSIKLKNLNNVKDEISRRFSLMKIENGAATKEQWPNMLAPPVSIEFPDIEYGSALVGEIDPGMYKPKALLYMMGGSKYSSLKNSLENIKHFSLFNFTAQAWEDLSGTLPEQLSQIAGHQLINIDDEKLIAFGGYKADNYTLQPRIAAVNPSINDFTKIFVYDIYKKKWETKSTIMATEDYKVLSSRKQYSTTAIYQNNKLYVYAGYRFDKNDSSTMHYFGILDLNIWTWKWYQIGFSSDFKEMDSTSFDSILVDGSMIVSHSNYENGSEVKFFKFDLNLGYYSNLSSLSSNLLRGSDDSTFSKSRSITIGLTVFLIIIAVIVFAVIIFLLYRYFRNSTHLTGEGIRFETEDIWSDPSIYATQTKNTSNRHLRQYRLYQCYIFQQLNSYSPLGQTFSYHEPETASIYESNSRTQVDMVQNLYKLPNNNESWDAYTTY
ncbi:hypothetical protein CONCODRAFT_80741 [Conidiobolus coronatus NRRL 28638]|uniref:Galactose oxidase n=1 Tax=Conidiobolus coronatus (strain ATCC 28846 / CBS 209.66 / NRRL 28638) TaxID=796925 RepID=A0A137NS00_CONC2|nr:hypothetical protein CONCODRAFT_80741 [Conidiobolus coronatus NRRL 28638]|eukprot:KXN65543.1 hypothetical protein CONCODRAFT_80741 [Conidiobolus coronatus NRRL 28638]